MIFGIIIGIPLVLLVFIMLFGMVDALLLDGAIRDLLSAWAEHWAEKHMPKKN